MTVTSCFGRGSKFLKYCQHFARYEIMVISNAEKLYCPGHSRMLIQLDKSPRSSLTHAHSIQSHTLLTPTLLTFMCTQAQEAAYEKAGLRTP